MKNKKILIIIGLVVLIGGAALFVLFGRGGKQAEVGSGLESGGEDKLFSGTLKAAVGMGVPMKCSYTIDGADYEGYVKGEQYMGKMVANGKVTNVIIKDNCMWSWEEEANQGVKTCYDMEEAGESIWQSSDGETGAADLNYSYTCRPAAVTDDKFVPPVGVSFMDLDKMMDGSMDPAEMEDYLQQFDSEE